VFLKSETKANVSTFGIPCCLEYLVGCGRPIPLIMCFSNTLKRFYQYLIMGKDLIK